jgi:uncharacterized YigZ family protein
MKDEIKVIRECSEAEYKEKGSRFIALAFYVQTEEEALTILEQTRKKYYDASHHCYAYKFNNNKTKYSDAGEPSGTAGIRILNAIEHFNLTEILIIVIRYFGGTKLGAGGLGRAYYKSASEVLNKAEIIKKKLYQKIYVQTDHQFIQKVYHILNSYKSIIIKTDYSNNVNVECLIIPGNISTIISRLNDVTNSTAEISEDKLVYQ